MAAPLLCHHSMARCTSKDGIMAMAIRHLSQSFQYIGLQVGLNRFLYAAMVACRVTIHFALLRNSISICQLLGHFSFIRFNNHILVTLQQFIKDHIIIYLIHIAVMFTGQTPSNNPVECMSIVPDIKSTLTLHHLIWQNISHLL